MQIVEDIAGQKLNVLVRPRYLPYSDAVFCTASVETIESL